jgi:hypothetical protein
MDEGDSGAGQGDEQEGGEPHNDTTDQTTEMENKSAGATYHGDKQIQKQTDAHAEMDGSSMKDTSSVLNPEIITGNSNLNFSQDVQELHTATNLTREPFSMTSSPSQPGTLLQAPSVTPLKKNTEGDKGKVDVREGMLIQPPLPTKRSKQQQPNYFIPKQIRLG